MQGNGENLRNSFWWSANPDKIRENDLQIFSRKCRNFLGGPRTETKFVKWSASRKRLRTTVIQHHDDKAKRLRLTLSIKHCIINTSVLVVSGSGVQSL